MTGELEVMRSTRRASLPERHPNRPRPPWLLPPARETKRETRKKGKGRAAG